MNKQRRAKIESEVLAARTAIEALRFAMDNLKDLATEEQDCFDNMPEGLQASDNGQRIEECATMLESAIATLQSALEDTEAALDEVREAMAQ